jgi:hypothetical protein
MTYLVGFIPAVLERRQILVEQNALLIGKIERLEAQGLNGLAQNCRALEDLQAGDQVDGPAIIAETMASPTASAENVATGGSSSSTRYGAGVYTSAVAVSSPFEPHAARARNNQGSERGGTRSGGSDKGPPGAGEYGPHCRA